MIPVAEQAGPTFRRGSALRVAFVGKGGAGKSAVAGTFARLLARGGWPVLAVDSDPMPGLAFSLGIRSVDAGIPDEAVVERAEGEDGPRYRLRPGLTAAEVIDRWAPAGPDGVRFLQFGKMRGRAGELARSQAAFFQVRRELDRTGWNVVGDLPGGTRQPFFGWGDFAETIVVVVEPTAKSLLSARRLGRLRANRQPGQRVVALASKVAGPADADQVAERTGLEVVASVPWDENVADAERRGLPVVDLAPDCPAVNAVAGLVERMLAAR